MQALNVAAVRFASMTDHIPVPYDPKRTFIIVVGVCTALLVGIFAVLSTKNDTATADLPPGILELFPPRDLVIRAQEQIGVKLDPEMTGELVLDDIPLPLDEYEVQGLDIGRIFWKPGINKTFAELEPGPHRITLRYWPKQEGSGGDNERTFTWTFKSA